MALGPKTRLGLMMATGGTCAIGTPIALYYNRGGQDALTQEVTAAEVRDTDLNQVSLDDPENYQNEESSTKFVENLRDSKVQRIEKQAYQFETFWTKLTEGYKKQQKDNKEATENVLSWKTELKDILFKDLKEESEEWKVEQEEYKDCAQISGGKTDYCGFLAIKVGDKEYRLKFDRYGKGGNQKKWDVTVVKNNLNSVQWYSKNKNSWETLSGKQIDQFKGANNSQYNHWTTLSGKSIEI